MVRTGIDLNYKTVEEFEELLTKLNQEFAYREAALKLRERREEVNDCKYGDVYSKENINEDCLDNVHNLIIDYVNK